MDAHDDNADRRYLKQAIERMEATLKEKELRDQAELAEENRRAEEAQRARERMQRECVDEKEILGAQILEKIGELQRDPLFLNAEKYSTSPSEITLIHKRDITEQGELLPDMPSERRVSELFQMTPEGVLTYNQVYTAKHFAEGLLQWHRLRDPLRFGMKLEKPADFRNLSITTVKQLLEAFDAGEPYRLATQSITKKSDCLKKELARTPASQNTGE